MIDLIRPGWPAPPRVQAICTTRIGGVSRAPYDECNLGLHVGDDPAAVEANRAQLRTQLALPAAPSWIEQTHSTHAIVLEETTSRVADATVSRRPGTVAAVLFADCLPILLTNDSASEVAALHAGWRGLCGGVVQSTLARLHSTAAELIAWIGPGISQPHFEVGDDVRAAYIEAIAGSGDYFVANRAGHWLCDLAGIAELILRRQGITRVVRDAHCTYRDRERLYSYRRDGITGRMAALIWII